MTKLGNQRDPRTYGALQLEITGTKNFEIGKLREKKNVQMQMAGNNAQI